MDYKAIFKTLTPHFGALIFFLAISALYMTPVFEGKTLKMHDISQYRGMVQEIVDHRNTYDDEPLWTGSMFSGMPAFQISAQYGFNFLKTLDKIWRLGLPRPMDFLFIYLLGFYVMLLSFKVNWKLAIPGATAFAFSTYFIIILAAGHTSKANAIAYMPPVLGAFWMIFKHRKYYLGTALFALFLALEIHANHLQVTYYLGILLAFLGAGFAVEAIKNKELKPLFNSVAAVFTGAILALAANAGNILSTYQYTALSTRGPSELTVNADGSTDKTDRTKGLDRSYVTAWSYGIDETLTLFIPNAKGGASAAVGTDHDGLKVVDPGYRDMVANSSMYWGTQRFTSGPVYVGASVFILFLLACLLLQGWIKYSLLGALALTIMLSWGKNFMGLTDFFLDYFPLYNKFRAVTIILVIAELIIPLMALMVLSKIWLNPALVQKGVKQFFTAFLVFIIPTTIMLFMPTLFFDFFSPDELENFMPMISGENGARIAAYMDNLEKFRIYIFRQDGMRSVFFAFITMLLVWYFSKGTLNKNVFAVAILLVFIADLYPINKRYLNNDKEKGKYVQWIDKQQAYLPFKANGADNALLKIEQAINPGVKDVIENRLKREQEQKFEREGKRKLNDFEQDAATFSALRKASNFRVLNLAVSPFNDASTSYFHRSVGGYHGAKLLRYQQLIDFHLNPEIQNLFAGLQNARSLDDAENVMRNLKVLNMLNTRYVVYSADAAPLSNPFAYGDGWAVERIKWVETADAEILSLQDENLRNTVVLNKKYEETVTKNYSALGRASVKLTDYKSNHLTYTIDSPQEQVIVFSEIFYPGWQAYVNGEKADHFQANFVLRAMVVPAGKSTVEFKFEPSIYNTVRSLQIAGNGLLLIIVGLLLFFAYKKKDATEEDAVTLS
ncbi:MAG: hypothetical protein ACXITV_11600 [Luteibaculaceae bacterium]